MEGVPEAEALLEAEATHNPWDNPWGFPTEGKYRALSGAVAIGQDVLRSHLNAVMMKFPKAGPGILRRLWAELLEERFGLPPR